MKLKSLWTALLAAVLVFLVHMTCAWAEPETTPFGIRSVNMLQADSGMSVHAWEEEAEKQKQLGLASPITEESLLAASPHARIHRENGQIFMLQGLDGIESIISPLDAYRTLYRFLPLLGIPDHAAFRLWARFTVPSAGIYSFQQIYSGHAIEASTVKIVTDPEGKVTALFTSLSDRFDHETGNPEITAADAERIVSQFLSENGAQGHILPEYTICTVISQEDADSLQAVLLAWVVYSENPHFGESQSSLPFLAHFVGMDGSYLHHVEALVPGDPAVQTGYSASYAFQFMEKAVWSGEVAYLSQPPVQLTVPVMRDSRTGAYYLADPERKIAVADFAKLAYGDETISLVTRTDNEQWDAEDLITYWNLIQVWDFYSRIGWTGPDGQGTPVLLLSNMQFENGEIIDNAAYCGEYEGWQCFACGGGMGTALDIIAHEFTHCVADTVMHTSLYQDDMGAISEATADILGNLCEMICREKTEDEWLIGEDLGTPIRSLSDPHRYHQPEHVWDLYYVPGAETPTMLNDRGGVHSNSSLLSYISSHLCMDFGMSAESARDFWLYTVFVLTPTNDYYQIAKVLPWALDASGNAAYSDALLSLLDATRLCETELPETLPEKQHAVTLMLPETPAFAGHDWILIALQLNTDLLEKEMDAFLSLGKHIIRRDMPFEAYLDQLASIFQDLHITPEMISLIAEDRFDLKEWLGLLAADLTSSYKSWRSSENSEIAIVLKQLPTLYLLLSLPEEDEGECGMSILLQDEWFDLSLLVDPSLEALNLDYLTRLFTKACDQAWSMLFPKEPESQKTVLTSSGLENVQLVILNEELFEGLPEDDIHASGSNKDGSREPS